MQNAKNVLLVEEQKVFLDNPVSSLYPEIIINNIILVVVLSYIIKLCCKDLNKLKFNSVFFSHKYCLGYINQTNIDISYHA